MSVIDFAFSDLIGGYVATFDKSSDTFILKTSDGRSFPIKLGANILGELVRNLGEPFHDATGQLRDLLVPGRYVFAYGIFYPDAPDDRLRFEAKHLVFLGRTENDFIFERQGWWIHQIRELADFYLEAEFGDGEIDYSKYRTNLSSGGQKLKSGRQETDTISRLVYGFASAFLISGEDRYLEAAEKGTQYLRDHLRFRDKSGGIVYWYHGIDINADGSEQKIFASEFGDDYDAIPCYEQIYALAGPTQTYRVTGDPKILEDIEDTISLFDRFFKDKTDRGGYYSHIDPITLSSHADSLGHNRARKNWNSVGDHAPAYLINLWLATGRKQFADFLEDVFDTITAHFPDYNESPCVQERFCEDWSKDQTWGWQQNRAVVGHNLKIAWNLMRMASLKKKDSYLQLAERIAGLMPQVGMDKQRGGWYDVIERVLAPGEKFHRFAWHDRKAWWQQEQGILAYLLLAGVLKNPEYLRLARESSAFYNTWFLDVEDGGLHFNVLANGQPYALGTERYKGSHSMSGYHSFELAYLAAIYTNLLITLEPMDLYFKPKSGGFADNILRVFPDILPAGSVKIGGVWIDGRPYENFDAAAGIVNLMPNHPEIKVRVRLVPAAIAFIAEVIEVSGGVARLALVGELNPAGIRFLGEALEQARDQQASALTLELDRLDKICSEALRYIIFAKQKLGVAFKFTIKGANKQVAAAIADSELGEEVTMIP